MVHKVSYPFQYNHLLQQRHIFLEPTLVYVLFCPWRIVGQIKITHYKFHRNFDLSPAPRSCEFPVSANFQEHVDYNIFIEYYQEITFLLNTEIRTCRGIDSN